MYLVDYISKFGGKCIPLSQPYKDNEGNDKVATNISVTIFNNRLISNTRLTDYMYVPINSLYHIQYITCNHDWTIMKSINTIQDVFGPSLPTLYAFEGDQKLTLNNALTYKGLEDVRLVVWNNTLYGIGFRPDIIPGKVTPQLIEYNDDLSVNRTWFIQTDKVMEKNWQPICDKPFTFMYDPDKSSTVVLDIDSLHESKDFNIPTTINDIDSPEYTGGISGSSQLIRMPNGNYISICHTSHRYRGDDGYMQWTYNNYFVIYDENLNKLWVSEPFHFTADCMEFCCGMCMDNENVYISFSIFDSITNIISIPVEDFDIMISEMYNGNMANYETHPAYDYIENIYDELHGMDILPCTFMLENIGRLKSPDRIVDTIENTDIPKHIKPCLYMYFITRRPDNEVLINNLNNHIYDNYTQN